MSTSESEAKLIVCNGKHAGTVFPLHEGDKKILGRDNNCHIQILDKGISRNHCLIEHKGDHFLLVDLGSTNGTFVNNKIIISRKLRQPDIIKLGQTEIKYEKVKPIHAPSVDLIIDNLILEQSPHTIMEKIDVSQSIFASSQQLRVSKKKGQDSLASLYLSTIYAVSNLVNEEHDLEKLSNRIIDKIIEVFQPDRAFLVMQEKEEFKVIVERSNTKAQLSQTILKKTIDEGISILSANAMLDDRFNTGMSIVTQQIKSVMSVPLASSDKILGAIYVDSIGASNCFEKNHLDLLAAIGKQAGVAIERTMLYKHSIENEKLKQALEIAQNIQKSLLPSEAPDKFPYDLVGWNLTCDETGGDYYDYFSLPRNRMGIAIGDVSGHGIGAALLMATARAFLKALALQSSNINNTMNDLNKLLEQDMEDDKFMTMFYGELDIRKMVLRYANAGHDAPLLYHKKTDLFVELESTGIPLGMMDDFEYEEEKEVKIFTGDILVLSTDGITESMNPEGEQFGSERLKELICQGANKSAYQIIKTCHDTVKDFCQGTPQRDDLTLVILKFDDKHKLNKEQGLFTHKYHNNTTRK